MAIKKTAYDLAGIQIRPAIQNLNTGEFLLWGSVNAGLAPQTRKGGFFSWLFRQ